MKFWNDPKYVSQIPYVTTALFSFGALSQLYRMWAYRTAAGQSLVGWSVVTLALVLFLQFYRVIIPKEKVAFYSCLGETFLYAAVIASIVYFRHYA
ncbi:MAG TPA: hypothetical protein VKT27_02810 [Candidatus Binataceae bacterium]|nr:hypothetical protein [Candidatus Binataceae bacterium]